MDEQDFDEEDNTPFLLKAIRIIFEGLKTLLEAISKIHN